MFVYIVDATKPQRGEFAVTLMPRGLQFREEEIFSLPAWAPGAYQLVHYGQYLRNLMAFDHRGEPLTVIKVDSNSWKIRPATQLSRLQYCITQMHRPDLLYPETTELNAQRGYFNGTNVFGYLHGYKDLPCMVQYRLPEGWQMASAIETAPNSQTAHARDYDELVDAPVMLGKFQRYDFTLLGKLHSVVIDADAKPMPDSLLALIKEIIVTHHRFFGELPYSKYLFLFRLVKPKTFWQFGALEHRNSSAYYMPLFDWDAVRYDPIATTISHEFFHLWNPKRFRSHLLGPFDYQHPIRTSTMWFVEGVTDYYAELLMVKGGIMSPQVFLRNMLERIRLMHLPKKRESLVALSRRLAYIEDNSEMFPFYTRGTVVAMLLDIYLRTHHPARCGTDELLQKLNLEYGKPEKPYHDDSLVTVLSCLAQVDIEPFYTRFIAGTDTLPLHAYFSKAGFYYGKRRRAVPQMGYFIQLDSSGALKVASVLPESAAERMGLKPDDEILAIDDVDTSRSSTLLERIFSLEGLKAGARVQIRVNRRGKVVKLTGRVGAQQSTVEVLELNEHATPLEAEVRRRMLTFQN
ncbi:MAG: PDZ domain-containing protein [Chloroherpetonaceae bacterium]|nr:PDZ domain-containing protein [Chloroherpetonaceae bacterium]